MFDLDWPFFLIHDVLELRSLPKTSFLMIQTHKVPSSNLIITNFIIFTFKMPTFQIIRSVDQGLIFDTYWVSDVPLTPDIEDV